MHTNTIHSKEGQGSSILLMALCAAILLILVITVHALTTAADSSDLVGTPVNIAINPTGEPAQVFLPTNSSPIIIDTPTHNWQLSPRAEYKIAARVLRRQEYAEDWLASLSPLDLALGWGDISHEDINAQLYWTQSNRWYYVRWSYPTPLPEQYIMEHSANVHIIPATENLGLAFSQIKPPNLVVIEGRLVDLAREDGITAHTSLTRTDSGANACEILYVERLVVDGVAYQ